MTASGSPDRGGSSSGAGSPDTSAGHTRTDGAPLDTRGLYRKITLIGFGFLGVQLAFTTYNAFLPLLYEEFLTSRALIGALMGTDNLVGLLLIPVIGAWSDRTTGRWGRRLPFVLVALPAAALTFAGIPWAAAALWTLIAADILFTAAIHAYRGPVISLMPDHTPPERRSTANGVINLMGGVGTIIALGGLSWAYDVDPRLAFGIGAVLMVATLPLVLRGADTHPPYIEHTSHNPRPFADTYEGIRNLFRAPQRGQRQILLAMACYFIGYAGLDAMFPLYGVNVLGLTGGEAARIITLFPVVFILTAVPAGMLGTRFGKVRAMQAGLVLLPVVFLIAPWITQPWIIAALFGVGGLGWALINVQAMPLVADLGGRSAVGFAVGLYYLFTMAGQMIGPSVLGTSMDLLGDRGLFYAGAASFVVALALLTRGWQELPADPVEMARRADAAALQRE